MSSARDRRKIPPLNVEPQMQEIEITIGRLLRVVWLLLWRAVLGGAVLGGVVGFVFGFVMALFGSTHEHIVLVNSIVGLVVGAIWWVAVVKMRNTTRIFA